LNTRSHCRGGWHLWHCYANPFNLLLTTLAVVSYLTEDAGATIVIGLMVLLSTAIRFVQEGRSHRAAEGPKSMVGNKATVLRSTIENVGDTALAGSANLDSRSLFLTYELMIAFHTTDDVRRFVDWFDAERAAAHFYVADRPGLVRDLAEGMLLWVGFQL